MKKLSIEEFEKNLEAAKQQQYGNGVVERLAEHQKITEKITKTDEYINWLESFTNKNRNFCDDDWLYCPEKISENDKDNVSKLGNFFEAVENYANKNHICSTSKHFERHYRIRYNNVGYEIGIFVGQGAIFFVRRQRVTKKNSDSFIDFKLIQENNIIERSEMISRKLKNLDELINSIAKDVPIESIVETIEKRLKLIKESKSR